MFWCDGFVRIVALLLISESNVCASFYPEENSITNLRNDDMVDVLVHLAQIKGMIDSIDEKLNSLDRKLDQRVTALDQTIGALDQRFNSLDKGMLELNVRLQLDTFKTELQDIRGACNRLLETSVAETTSYPVSPKPATTFQITRVTKEDTGGTFQVRVEYEASSPPSAILLNVDSNELVTKLEEQNFGVVEFEVPNNEGTSVNTRFERTLLHFIIKEQVHVAMLNLYSTPDVMLVPAIQFQVEQGSDVIFQPGRDVVIDLTLKVEGDPDHLSRDDFSFKWIMKDNLAENKLNRYRLYSVESPIMTHMKVDGELGNGHAKITVLSRSDRESEGILDIYGDVSFNCSRNCLLDKAQSHVSVQLRREDRPGPLPEGFLGFIHDDQKGDPSTVCCAVDPEREQHDCVIPCEVGGAEPSTTEITKILPNGDVIPTADVTVSGGWWSKSILVLPNVTLADSGEFRCTARSESKVITMDISVIAFKPAKIDTNSSSFTELENGSVEGVCIAEGIPAPNVSFQHSYYTDLHELDPEDYVITVTQLDEFRTRAEVVVTDPDKAEKFRTCECFAANLNIEEYPCTYFGDYHTMYRN